MCSYCLSRAQTKLSAGQPERLIQGSVVGAFEFGMYRNSIKKEVFKTNGLCGSPARQSGHSFRAPACPRSWVRNCLLM